MRFLLICRMWQAPHALRQLTRMRPQRLIRLVAMHGLLVIPSSAWAQKVDPGAVAARVADAVCGKQVVILGELPSHGEALAFQAKAEIVQRLVDQCGFDALLFEAPLYDFVGFQEAVEQQTAAASQLDRAIGRFWWTRELTDWRRWLFRQAMEGGLVLGGLDDQVSVTSDYARATLPGLVAAWSPPRDASECEEAVARHLYWRYDTDRPFDEPEKIRLQQCAREAADAFGRAEGSSGTPRRAMLENFAGYVDRQRGAPAPLERDEAMHRNALRYIGRMPAGSKVIIWTATVHAARQQGGLPQQPLGARLAARWEGQLAAVGFTAYAGWSSMAGQPRKALPEAPPGSLEARATEGNVPWAFLNASALRSIGPAPSRLLGGFTAADWSTCFDGVVVIREEVAPTFDPWTGS
jgi:erythromycin esterase-like protein